MPSIIKRTKEIIKAWDLYEQARPEGLEKSMTLPPQQSTQPAQPVGTATVAAAMGGAAGAVLGVKGALAVTAATFIGEVAQWIRGPATEEVTSLRLEYLKPLDLVTVAPRSINPQILKSLQKRYDELVAYQMLKMTRGVLNTGFGSDHQENVIDDEKYFVTSLLGLKIIEIAKSADNAVIFENQINHWNSYLELISSSEDLLHTRNDNDFKYLSLRTLVVDLRQEQKEIDKDKKNQRALEKLSSALAHILGEVRRHADSLITRLIKVATPFDMDEIQIYKGVKDKGLKNIQTISQLESNPLFEGFQSYFLDEKGDLDNEIEIPQLKKFLAKRSNLIEGDIPEAAAVALQNLLISKKQLIKLKILLEDIMFLKREGNLIGLSHIIGEMKFVVEKLKEKMFEIEEHEFAFHKELKSVYLKSTDRQFKNQFAAVAFNQSFNIEQIKYLDKAILLLTSLSAVDPQEIIDEEQAELQEKINNIKTQVAEIKGSSKPIVHDPEILQASLMQSKTHLEDLQSWIMIEGQKQSNEQSTAVEDKKENDFIAIEIDSEDEEEQLNESELQVRLDDALGQVKNLKAENDQLKLDLQKALNVPLQHKINDLEKNPLVENNSEITNLLQIYKRAQNGLAKEETIDITIKFFNMINNTYLILARLQVYIIAYKEHVNHSWNFLRHNRSGIANAEEKYSKWHENFVEIINRKISDFMQNKRINNFGNITDNLLTEFNTMMEDQIKFWILHINRIELYSGDNKHSYKNYLLRYTEEILGKDKAKKLKLNTNIDLKSDMVQFSKKIEDINNEVNQTDTEYLKKFMFNLRFENSADSLNTDYSNLYRKTGL